MKGVVATVVLIAGLAAMPTAGQAGTELDFALVNKTGYPIEEVYLSPSGTSDWQENVISGDVLEDTQVGRIAFSVGGKDRKCLWDLRVVYSDRATAEWGQLDLCSSNRITLRYDQNSGKTQAEIK